MAYIRLDKTKIIDFGWCSSSVATSTVGPTLPTAELYVVTEILEMVRLILDTKFKLSLLSEINRQRLHSVWNAKSQLCLHIISWRHSTPRFRFWFGWSKAAGIDSNSCKRNRTARFCSYKINFPTCGHAGFSSLDTPDTCRFVVVCLSLSRFTAISPKNTKDNSLPGRLAIFSFCYKINYKINKKTNVFC